jgi:hypothetical protein
LVLWHDDARAALERERRPHLALVLDYVNRESCG